MKNSCEGCEWQISYDRDRLCPICKDYQYNESKPLFGGLAKYFLDLEKYQNSLCCDECGNEELMFRRTTSNNEVHWCNNCKREQITVKRPKEDNY